MFNVQTFNKISKKGLNYFLPDAFFVSDSLDAPDAYVLRSYNLHESVLPSSLKAIGRAGAGVNNIPVDKCTEKGVVVFNAPGANANAVKELVLSGMLLSARDIYGGIRFVHDLEKNEHVPNYVEKNKSRFSGFEIKGKQLGVIGLGAIGLMVANAAISLGMTVMGHDPFLSVHRAWELSSDVTPAPSLEKMLRTSDFITIHVPFTSETKAFFTADRLSHIKRGGVLLNFSRADLVQQDALLEALDSGQIAKYITDFPNANLLGAPNVIPIPHLGASTVEAEDNCAVMVVEQIKAFFSNSTIT